MKLYRETGQFGIIAALFGAVSMVAWLIPVVGLIMSLISIFLGFYAYEDDNNGFSLAGIALGFVSLILVLIRSGMVYYYG